MPVSQISVISRATQGVRLIRLHENDKLVSVAKIVKE
jgi:DNA gyrase/topoisomerase IV subunit A